MERRRRMGWLALFILLMYLAAESIVPGLIPGPVDAAMGTHLRVLCLEPPTRLVLQAGDIEMQPALGIDHGNQIVIRWELGRHIVERDGEDDFEVDGPIRLTWTGVGTWVDGKSKRRSDIGSMTLTEIKGKRALWVTVGIEAYLSGILAREMNSRFPIEALKAQAVAARSFALEAVARRRKLGKPWDLRGGESDMVYRGIDSSARILKALRETRGQVMAFDEKILRSYFGATCGGQTRDGLERFRDVPAAPYATKTCTGCEGIGRYRWKHKVERAKVDSLFPSLGKGDLVWEVQTRSARGDWRQFRVRSGTASTKSLDMTRMSGSLGLSSPWITRVSMKGEDVLFEGNGHGHGVGLCQNGAKGYAKAGWNYQQILAFYYNETPLRKIGN